MSLIDFCSLGSANPCDLAGYVNQLQTLLCEAQCDWDEVKCVAAGTPTTDFEALWTSGGCADAPCGAMVVELTSPPTVWVYVGVNWNVIGTDNEVRVAPIGTPIANFNTFFAGGVPSNDAIVVRQPTELFYTNDAGLTWTPLAANVSLAVQQLTFGTLSNALTSSGFYPRQTYWSTSIPLLIGQTIQITQLISREITQFAQVLEPTSITDFWVVVGGTAVTATEFENLGLDSPTFRHTSWHTAIATGNLDWRVDIQFGGSPPPNGDPDKIWRWRQRVVNYGYAIFG